MQHAIIILQLLLLIIFLTNFLTHDSRSLESINGFFANLLNQQITQHVLSDHTTAQTLHHATLPPHFSFHSRLLYISCKLLSIVLSSIFLENEIVSQQRYRQSRQRWNDISFASGQVLSECQQRSYDDPSPFGPPYVAAPAQLCRTRRINHFQQQQQRQQQ